MSYRNIGRIEITLASAANIFVGVLILHKNIAPHALGWANLIGGILGAVIVASSFVKG